MVRRGPESTERQLVDGRVRFAQSHLVTVDHVVEQSVEVHDRTPTIAEFTHVVGEHTESTAVLAQIVHELQHGLAPNEVEVQALLRRRRVGG